MTREEEKNKARFEYVSKRLANPDFPTYNAEYELEAAFDEGVEWTDQHPHWISVKDEEFPKEGEMVLAFRPDDTFQFTTTFFTTIDVWKKLGITHWMPLPSVEHLKDK